MSRFLRTVRDLFEDGETCSDCGSWIDEGEDVYEDDNGNYLCNDCK